MEKIMSITEAYSMQPASFAVVPPEMYEHYYDKERACKEIKREQALTDVGKVENEMSLVYVGYNYDGKKLFQYLANSVNVTYFT